MYLGHCPANNNFKVTEIWAKYAEREKYKENGLKEGTMIYVKENDGKNILITLNTEEYYFTYEEALNICGNVILKNKTKVKKLV